MFQYNWDPIQFRRPNVKYVFPLCKAQNDSCIPTAMSSPPFIQLNTPLWEGRKYPPPPNCKVLYGAVVCAHCESIQQHIWTILQRGGSPHRTISPQNQKLHLLPPFRPITLENIESLDILGCHIFGMTNNFQIFICKVYFCLYASSKLRSYKSSYQNESQP